MDCHLEDERRQEWADWQARWDAAPGAEFALGSTGTVHRRGSCVLVPESPALTDPALRREHHPPATWPLAEEDAAILLLSEHGRACKLCIPARHPTNLRAWMA